MSGIFVDENDKFDIVVNYLEEKNNIKILKEKEDGCKSLTVTFKYPDFATSQEIAKSSVENLENGPTLNMFRLRANMIYYLAIGWDAKNKDGKNVNFLVENINKLQPSIVVDLVNQVQLKIGETGVLLV